MGHDTPEHRRALDFWVAEMSDIVERLEDARRFDGDYAYLQGEAAREIRALRAQLQTVLTSEKASTARYYARIAELEASNLQTWRNLKRLWALASGNDPDDNEEGPRCRDCADMDGVCHSGLPCDPQKRAEVQMTKLRARVAELEAENARLRDALSDIARQKLEDEMVVEEVFLAEFQEGYEGCVRRAREALKETE